MRNLFFSQTTLRYPKGVKVAAALILAAAIGVMGITSTDIGTALSILIPITAACTFSFLLAERFYELSVLLLCAVHMGIVGYASIVYYILNASPVFMSALMDITLAGLLLGGLGATIVTAYNLVILAIGEAFIFSGATPMPATAPHLTIANQISGATLDVAIILVVYFIVVFFASTVRNALSEASRQRDELRTTNLTLQRLQAEELGMAQQVSILAQRVATSVEQQSAAAQEQANQSSNLATALTELEQNIQLINQTSRNVKQAVDAASAEAQSGKGATDMAVAALTNISATVEQMAEQITNLTAQAREVSTVLDIINEVADETRLLALNAAIESASAGTYGNRFSIIADEVGSLAERTRQAVGDINTLVNKIEEAANEAIKISSYGLTQSKESTSLTSAAGVAHQSILSSVDNTAILVQSIAVASDQQRQASESAVVHVQQLSLTAQQVAQSSSNLVGVVHELTAVASRLTQQNQELDSAQHAGVGIS